MKELLMLMMCISLASIAASLDDIVENTNKDQEIEALQNKVDSLKNNDIRINRKL